MNEARTGGNQFELRFSPSLQLGESTAMSVPHNKGLVATLSTSVAPRLLRSSPASQSDREFLRGHLQREALHASYDRDFANAFIHAPDAPPGTPPTPKMHRFGSSTLPKCQYVVLTSQSYRAVLVVDIDRKGKEGGWAECIDDFAATRLEALIKKGFGPAWLGVNPINGKAQAIWHIDPVYAAVGSRSSNIELYDITANELDTYLGCDRHFSRKFSRSPFYEGDSLDAYHWHCYHHDVHRLRGLLDALRGGGSREEPVETFASGYERIEAAKRAREARKHDGIDQAKKSSVYDLPHDEVDGITVYWSEEEPGIALRDVTAFYHALGTGYQLKAAGKSLKDDLIKDAYTKAYLTAHEVGGGLRPNELPGQRDLTSMAARVRAYVYGTKKNTDEPRRARQSTAGRKALATMGRRGGQKAAQRWKTDPDGEYAQSQRKNLQDANKRKRAAGNNTRAQILAIASQVFNQTGRVPTWKEIAQELNISRRTVAYHVAALKEVGLYPEV